MKRILIIGGFGFISSNILKFIDGYFVDKYSCIVFDRIDKHPHGVSFNCVEKVYSGDFSDETNLNRIFQENKIDFVLHLLSSTVPSTSNNAIYDVESNLIPTLKMLDIMDRYGVRDIIYMSSGGAVYGDFLKKIHSEDDAVYPKSSYGVVKLAIEKYLLSYSELYNFNTLILRLSNPYGPYHYNKKQGIINIAIRKALTNEPLQVWGTGNGTKDYIYIKDVCALLFKLVENGVETSVINIASGNAISVNDICKAVKKEIPEFKYEYVKNSLTDVESFELDITKLLSKIGQFKFSSFEESLKETIIWEIKQTYCDEQTCLKSSL